MNISAPRFLTHKALAIGVLAVAALLAGCGEVDPAPAAPATFTILEDGADAIVWGGGASRVGTTINIALIDAETGDAVSASDGVQIIFSAADGGDLSLVDLPGDSLSFSVDALQPQWMSVVDTQQARTISFFGNAQAPLRREYAVPITRPVSYDLSVLNLPASVGLGTSTLQVLVNGKDVSASATLDEGSAQITLSSGLDLIDAGSFRKGQPVMVCALVRDASTGRIQDGVAFVDQVGITADTQDWVSFSLIEAGTTPGGRRQVPMSFSSFVEGQVLVPTLQAGVTAHTEDSKVVLSSSNAYGGWEFSGRLLGPTNANTSYEVDYPIFRDDELEVEAELDAEKVRVELAQDISSGRVWIDLHAEVTTPAAQNLRANDLMLKSAVASIDLATTSIGDEAQSANAWLVADIGMSRRMRAALVLDDESGNLNAPWLAGRDIFPLTINAASLLAGNDLLERTDGAKVGLGINDPGVLPVVGSFNTLGDSLNLSVDARIKRPGSLGFIESIETSVVTPISAGNMNLAQGRLHFVMRNVQTQEGLIQIEVGGDVGGAPLSPVSWTLVLPIAATHAAGSSEYSIALPRLGAAPSDYSPSTNDDAVSFSICLLDITGLGLNDSALDFRALAADSGRAPFSLPGSRLRSFALATLEDVDLQ